MKKLWILLGRIAFVVIRPLGQIYLHWAGPRTRLVVISHGSILLVKDWLGNGRWKLPGGGLHHNEPALAGAIRELHEETGLSLQPNQLTELGQLQQGRLKLICFKAQLAQPTASKPGWPEVIAADWRPVKDLSQLEQLDEETRLILTNWPISDL